MSNDKMAEALRDLRTVLLDDSGRCTLFIPLSDCHMIDRALAVIGAHAAEAVQPQAQNSEWVMVPKATVETIVAGTGMFDHDPKMEQHNAYCRAIGTLKAMLASAPQHATEPVASRETFEAAWAQRSEAFSATDKEAAWRWWRTLHPQPAQDAEAKDAARYRFAQARDSDFAVCKWNPTGGPERDGEYDPVDDEEIDAAMKESD